MKLYKLYLKYNILKQFLNCSRFLIPYSPKTPYKFFRSYDLLHYTVMLSKWFTLRIHKPSAIEGSRTFKLYIILMKTFRRSSHECSAHFNPRM